jgi:hypothetical protein
MPQIGELSQGLWLASGFGGHGLNTTAMAGELIARAIVEGDDTWRLFLPYELIWTGGTFGRMAAQARYVVHRVRTQFEAGRARRREAARRKAEELAAIGSVDAAARHVFHPSAERAQRQPDDAPEPPTQTQTPAAAETPIQPGETEPDASTTEPTQPRSTAAVK